MPAWIEWCFLALSLALMTAGLIDRQHGGRLALIGALLAATSTARLVPDSAVTSRVAAWVVVASLMIYAFATTSKDTYRKTRLVLSLAAAAVATIWLLEIPGLPGPAEWVLLTALVILVAAMPLAAIARVMKPRA